MASAKILENVRNTDEDAIDEIVRGIKENSSPVIIPLDTSYVILSTHYDYKPKELPKLAIGSMKQLKHHIDTPGSIVNKLVKNFWPGPLELILKNRKGDKIILNFPSENICATIIKKSGQVPLFGVDKKQGQKTGHGLWFEYCLVEGKPITAREQLVRKYGTIAKVIVFNGSPKFNFPPSRVDVTTFPPHILTPGAIPTKLLEDYFRTKVLFVCSGNTCRSPLALYLFKKIVEEKNLASYIEADSCGTLGGEGLPISENSMTILKEMGITTTKHSSKGISHKLLKNSDKIFCMQQQHIDYIKSLFPDIDSNMELLDPDNDEIDDPVGAPLETYRNCTERIISSIEKRLGKLITEGRW